MLDVLEGRAEAADPKIARAADVYRDLSRGVAAEAKAADLLVERRHTFQPGEEPTPEMRLKPQQKISLRLAAEKKKSVTLRVKVPFQERQAYFPHVIPSPESLRFGRSGTMSFRTAAVGIWPEAKTAATALDQYRKFVEGGERAKLLEKYLVETGQAANESEAFRLLEIFRRRRIQRQGSLEFSREVDLPFYDPDPLRVLPPLLHADSMRLAEIREFGQANQQINKTGAGPGAATERDQRPQERRQGVADLERTGYWNGPRIEVRPSGAGFPARDRVHGERLAGNAQSAACDEESSVRRARLENGP